MDGQEFCLKWDGFQSSVTSVFDHLRQDEELVDITLCCEGQRVKAHRMMLSACSPYFRDLFIDNPCQKMVVFLKDTPVADLHAIIEFVYKGHVNVCQSQLASFIKTAEMLQIRGLSGEEDKVDAKENFPKRGEDQHGPSQSGSDPSGQGLSGPGPLRSCPELSAPSSDSPRMRLHPLAPRLDPPAPCLDSSAPCLDPPGPRAVCPGPRPYPGGPRQRQADGGTPPAKRRRGSTSALDPVDPAGPADPAAAEESPGSPQSSPPTPPPPRQPAAAAPAGPPPADAVKVEKVDLTEKEDASLDATLGYVAEYEGGYGESDLSEGALDTLGPAGGDGLSLAMPAAPTVCGIPSTVLRGASSSSDSGASQDTLPCPECGRRYSNPRSLECHRKVHALLTICPLCGKVASKVGNLRRHLETVHTLTPSEIRQIVPTRPRGRQWTEPAGQGAGTAAN